MFFWAIIWEIKISSAKLQKLKAFSLHSAENYVALRIKTCVSLKQPGWKRIFESDIETKRVYSSHKPGHLQVQLKALVGVM